MSISRFISRVTGFPSIAFIRSVGYYSLAVLLRLICTCALILSFIIFRIPFVGSSPEEISPFYFAPYVRIRTRSLVSRLNQMRTSP